MSEDYSQYDGDITHDSWVDNSYYMNTGQKPWIDNATPQQPINQQPRKPKTPVSERGSKLSVAEAVILVFAFAIAVATVIIML